MHCIPAMRVSITEPRFAVATQPEKESEVSDVKASRNSGQPEGHPHRGQRRLRTRRHAPVILISVLFNLAELGAKPVGQAVPRDTMAVSQSDDAVADFKFTQTMRGRLGDASIQSLNTKER